MLSIYYNNLYLEVAINTSPIIPTVILAGNGKAPKNIETPEPKAKISPMMNCIGIVVFSFIRMRLIIDLFYKVIPTFMIKQ